MDPYVYRGQSQSKLNIENIEYGYKEKSYLYW